MMKNKFKVIIPTYNAEDWIQKCLASIVRQTYTEWQAIIINDASTDNTHQAILDYCKYLVQVDKFRLIVSPENGSPLRSIVCGTREICKDPEEIIVIVDGDDWLYDANVFARLNEVYQDPNIWLTYGTYVNASNYMPGVCKPLFDIENYRADFTKWCTSHLRTYKYHLWSKVGRSQLIEHETGQYYTMAGDLAAMYPMLEMAGIDRIKYIEEFTYVYNDLNPLNEHKISVDKQWKLAREIGTKPRYRRIPDAD